MSSYNYIKIKRSPELINKLPEYGTWLPVNSAAEQTGWSGQMIRILFFKEIIEAIRFKNGPMLVDIDRISSIPKQTWKNKEQNHPL
jgi:hypothetical protein